MPADLKPKSPVNKAAAPAQAQPDWENLLENLATDRTSAFIFPKGPKTRVRLVHNPAEPYFTEIQTEFRGKAKTKYAVLAVQMDAAGDDEEGPKVKALVISKTVFRQIVQMLTEGYDLWDPEKGFGITILRQGSGLETNYSVLPSPRPVPVDPHLIEQAPDFASVQEEYAKLRERQASKAGKDGADSDETGEWS